MKYAYMIAGLALGLTLPSLAFGAIAVPEGETGITVTWGEQAAWAITAAAGILGGVWASVVGLLPGPARWFIKTAQIDQVIIRSIQAWMVEQAEDIADKGFTADLRVKAVRDITVMSLNTGNKFVKEIRDTLPVKVQARLQEYIEKQAGKAE